MPVYICFSQSADKPVRSTILQMLHQWLFIYVSPQSADEPVLSTILHMFPTRVLTSLYEALTIHKQLHCSAQQKDFLPLWFLYCIAAMNALLVRKLTSRYVTSCRYLLFTSGFQCIFKYSDLPLRWTLIQGQVPRNIWNISNQNKKQWFLTGYGDQEILTFLF